MCPIVHCCSMYSNPLQEFVERILIELEFQRVALFFIFRNIASYQLRAHYDITFISSPIVRSLLFLQRQELLVHKKLKNLRYWTETDLNRAINIVKD